MLIILFLSLVYSKDFIWGVSTAAYQIEGAVDDRGKNIWDVFSHIPGKTHNNETGDVADDSYHRYKEDISLIADLGVSHYRFSISWSRIFPTIESYKTGGSNKGIKYYNDIIDELIDKKIEPFVTLYHWDLPQYLDWLSKDEIISYFLQYSTKCFELFGDRVKNWLTLNEPLSFAVGGYSSGNAAPGRCSNRSICDEGDSGKEPYIVGYHALLAHAKAYREYESKFKSTQKGRVGITLNFDYAIPYSNSASDIKAAERNKLFKIGWFADPIVFGDFPNEMKENVGSRLPIISEEESKIIKGSFDFFAMNHYTTQYIYNKELSEKSWDGDQNLVQTAFDKEGKQIGEQADSEWLYVVPYGFRKALNWVSNRYKSPEIIITENGVDCPKEGSMHLPEVLNDTFRINYINKYTSEMMKAKHEDKVNITGYFLWSVLDNYEWADGYRRRFGIVYIDRNNNLKRTKKNSFTFYSNLIKRKYN